MRLVEEFATLAKPLDEGGPTKADELFCNVGEATLFAKPPLGEGGPYAAIFPVFNVKPDPRLLEPLLGDGGPTKALPCNIGELAAREADAPKLMLERGATGPTLETLIGSRPKFVDVNGLRSKKS